MGIIGRKPIPFTYIFITTTSIFSLFELNKLVVCLGKSFENSRDTVCLSLSLSHFPHSCPRSGPHHTTHKIKFVQFYLYLYLFQQYKRTLIYFLVLTLSHSESLTDEWEIRTPHLFWQMSSFSSMAYRKKPMNLKCQHPHFLFTRGRG